MDWIRRNWPDLLIGLALILVISGIIITLLNGGTFNPFGQSGAGTASLPSRPAASEAVETEQLGADDADVSVLPLPSVGDPITDDQVDTTTDSTFGENVNTAVEDASESLSETADEIDVAAQGVLPDPNETTLNDARDEAIPLTSDVEIVDVDAAADAAPATDNVILDNDVAEQAGNVEAVLPGDSDDVSTAHYPGLEHLSRYQHRRLCHIRRSYGLEFSRCTLQSFRRFLRRRRQR